MTNAVEIPDKHYFKIGEVGELTGVEPHVLRYWESVFPNIHPQRVNKQRLYRRVDVENILNIKELLYEKGFTISGARKELRLSRKEQDEAIDPAEAKPFFDSLKKELCEIKKLLEK